jgi:hypothetical protein
VIGVSIPALNEEQIVYANYPYVASEVAYRGDRIRDALGLDFRLPARSRRRSRKNKARTT